MATTKLSSRYNSIDSHSSSSSTSTSSSNKKNPISGSKPRYKPSDLAGPTKGTTSQAITRAKSTTPQGQNLGSLLRKLIDKRSMDPKKHGPPVLPPDPIAKEAKGAGKPSGSNISALSRKLFQKGAEKKALTEVKSNTRTLAMVLRSERELLAQNKEYEDEICELRLLLEERNNEIEKLKDLCLKQREEIKALKDAVLFPEETNMQMQYLVEKQGEDLEQAKQVIPALQREVSSLTAHFHCLALDLAQVKAEKHGANACIDGLMSPPRTPILHSQEETTYTLESSTSRPEVSEYGSSDEMFLKDFNPCLTPRFSKQKFMD
ncbi:structural maintenance of chromosomes protein [Rhynchospora pubera]|uniref:Structural maintenance of chromosomes protein n=1 Tax=Rhynchospora pubera TaxID=906938 RepID=A0AAV8H8Q9_9POAL|nr:structural maintenance of chromosomes protein [Rhynchospora pubera]